MGFNQHAKGWEPEGITFKLTVKKSENKLPGASITPPSLMGMLKFKVTENNKVKLYHIITMEPQMATPTPKSLLAKLNNKTIKALPWPKFLRKKASELCGQR